VKPLRASQLGGLAGTLVSFKRLLNLVSSDRLGLYNLQTASGLMFPSTNLQLLFVLNDLHVSHLVFGSVDLLYSACCWLYCWILSGISSDAPNTCCAGWPSIESDSALSISEIILSFIF